MASPVKTMIEIVELKTENSNVKRENESLKKTVSYLMGQLSNAMSDKDELKRSLDEVVSVVEGPVKDNPNRVLKYALRAGDDNADDMQMQGDDATRPQYAEQVHVNTSKEIAASKPSRATSAGVLQARPSLEHSHTTDQVPNIDIRDKLKEGMGVQELMAHLDADGDGQVSLEDLQSFMMLNASEISEELAVGTTTNNNRNEAGRDYIGGRKEPKINGAFSQVRAEEEETDTDKKKDGLHVAHNSVPDSNRHRITYPLQEGKASSNNDSATGQFEQRLRNKLESDGNTTANTNPSCTSPRDHEHRSTYPLLGTSASGGSAEDKFEQRLRNKLESDSNIATKSPSCTPLHDHKHRATYALLGRPASGDSARDKFEQRLKQKVKSDSNIAAKSPICISLNGHEHRATNTLLGTSASGDSAEDKFEQRLKQKVGSDSNIAAKSPSCVSLNDHKPRATYPLLGRQASCDSAEDKFAQRFRNKLESDGNLTAAANQSLAAFDNEDCTIPKDDEPLRANKKSLAARAQNDGDRSNTLNDSNAAASLENFEKRLRIKLDQGGNSDVDENSDGNITAGNVQIWHQNGKNTNNSHVTLEESVDNELDCLSTDKGDAVQNNEEDQPACRIDSTDAIDESISSTVTIERDERTISSNSGHQVGAVRFHQQATFLESRLHLRGGEHETDAHEQRDHADIAQPRRSWSSSVRRTMLNRLIPSYLNSSVWGTPITATLVEGGEEGEIVVAERVMCSQRTWKIVTISKCLLLVALAVSMSLLLISDKSDMPTPPTDELSMEPSSSPSYGPTLEIVQSRGHVRCGLDNATIESKEGLRLDLCRAVAAVIFGDPESFVGVLVTGSTRFEKLNDRAVDLLLYGDTHTIEREVKERTTDAGFTFSSPYYYDGMAYFGDECFLRCAEEEKRFDECTSLLICVTEGSTSYDYVQSHFPPDFVQVVSTKQETEEMLFNGTCNVIASDRSLLLDIGTPDDGRKFIVGDKLMTKEPLSIVTRNNDREFSDIINWIVHALFYGEEQGLTKNSSLCTNSSNLTQHHASDLNFMNAVYCVGNYGELFDEDENNRGLNQINDGSTGMLYATPFGQLNHENDYLSIFATGDTLIDGIREKGSLNCGVIVPEDFDGQITNSSKLVGMSVDYCQTLTAALFNGDSKVVNWSTFMESDESSFVALNNGTIDVLAGGRVEKKYDFGSSSSFSGFQFSTPYYFGNETAGEDVSFFAFTTREDDVMFTSFVNFIILATIYAQEEGMERDKSEEIWVLRDAIAYSGGYDQIYKNNFENVTEGERGRNILNINGGPQIHSFPGLTVRN